MTEEELTIGDELIIAAIVQRAEPLVRGRQERATARLFQKFLKRYDNALVVKAWRQLSVKYEWLWHSVLDALSSEEKVEFTAQMFESIAEILEEGGLRVEDHLRLDSSGEGWAITFDAADIIRAAGHPDMDGLNHANKTLEGMGLDRNPFVHPLSEKYPPSEEIPEATMNLWAMASFLISEAMGWVDGERTAKALIAIKDAVSIVAPTMDTGRLLERARYDDSALLKVCNLLVQSFEQKINQEVNRGR